MKLVDISGSGHYINMDYIISVYKKADNFYVEFSGHIYSIIEKAYNTILKYGKAEI